jgi:hypothetical protein
MRHRLTLGFTVTAILIGLGLCPVVLAQDPARAMLVGRWEGTATFGESSPAVLVFSEAGGALKWTYSFKYDVVLWGDAAGTIASFTGSNLQLTGAWTKHAVPGAAGTGVKFTLTVDGDQMKGTQIADMNNQPIAISLTRKK